LEKKNKNIPPLLCVCVCAPWKKKKKKNIPPLSLSRLKQKKKKKNAASFPHKTVRFEMGRRKPTQRLRGASPKPPEVGELKKEEGGNESAVSRA
jgi:hypothetical protein